jgi:hypothetical protein
VKVKSAYGIEADPERFCRARGLAKRRLTKKELKRMDFFMDNIEDVRLKDVTVAYHGLEFDSDDVRMYRKLFGKRRVRLIRRDLPVIGYAPVDSARDSSTTWFFLMSYPLTKYRCKTKDEWARSFLGPKATIKDVFMYYETHLKRRRIIDRKEIIRNVKRLVNRSLR